VLEQRAGAGAHFVGLPARLEAEHLGPTFGRFEQAEQ
jgi:hypothetical protein